MRSPTQITDDTPLFAAICATGVPSKTYIFITLSEIGFLKIESYSALRV